MLNKIIKVEVAIFDVMNKLFLLGILLAFISLFVGILDAEKGSDLLESTLHIILFAGLYTFFEDVTEITTPLGSVIFAVSSIYAVYIISTETTGGITILAVLAMVAIATPTAFNVSLSAISWKANREHFLMNGRKT